MLKSEAAREAAVIQLARQRSGLVVLGLLLLLDLGADGDEVAVDLLLSGLEGIPTLGTVAGAALTRINALAI